MHQLLVVCSKYSDCDWLLLTWSDWIDQMLFLNYPLKCPATIEINHGYYFSYQFNWVAFLVKCCKRLWNSFFFLLLLLLFCLPLARNFSFSFDNLFGSLARWKGGRRGLDNKRLRTWGWAGIHQKRTQKRFTYLFSSSSPSFLRQSRAINHLSRCSASQVDAATCFPS